MSAQNFLPPAPSVPSFPLSAQFNVHLIYCLIYNIDDFAATNILILLSPTEAHFCELTTTEKNNKCRFTVLTDVLQIGV